MNTSLSASLISALAGFLGVLVGTALVPWMRGHLARGRAARYLAIRIVCALDKFVDDCSEIASYWGEDSSGEPRVEVMSRSRGPAYPEEVDWHSIEHSLMYDVLSLPTATERLNRYLEGAAAVAVPPDDSNYLEDRNFRYAQLGIRANALAKRFRNQYRIPEFEPTDWSPVNHLNEVLFDIEKLRRARAASSLIAPYPREG
jgi:hypothetical protein